MRFANRTLIAVAVFAAAVFARGQEPPSQDVSPTPAASPAVEAAPVAPNVESAAAPEATPIPAEPAVAPPPAAPVAVSPQSESPAAAFVAPAPAAASPARAPRAAKSREAAKDRRAPQNGGEAATAPAATAAVAQSTAETLPTPAVSGATSPAADAAVAPVPVAEQRPVVPPAAEEESAPAEHRTGSTWLLIGGLALGAIGVAAMLSRRRRDDSLSIMEHTGPIPTRRDSALPHRS